VAACLGNAQFGVARRRAVNFACGYAEMPSDDFHRPVRQVTELMVKEVQGRKKLPVISRESFAQYGA
jgi:hypothetical protein